MTAILNARAAPQSNTSLPLDDAVYLRKVITQSVSNVVLPDALAGSVLFGVYTLLILYTGHLVMRQIGLRGPRTRPQGFMVIVWLAMYAIAATSWALVAHDYLVHYRNSTLLTAFAEICLDDIMDGKLCQHEDIGGLPTRATLSRSFTTTVLPWVNILLSDAVVLWSACAVWRSRIVTGVSVVLFLPTLVILILHLIVESRGSGEYLGLFIVYTLIWISTVFATVLLYKKLRRFMDLSRKDPQTRGVRRMAIFFAFSGFVYSILWLLIAVFGVLGAFFRDEIYAEVGKVSDFYLAMRTLVSSGLVHITGIYATFLIFLRAFIQPYDSSARGLQPLGSLKEDMESLDTVPLTADMARPPMRDAVIDDHGDAAVQPVQARDKYSAA